MEIKLFGKSLFEAKKSRNEFIFNNAIDDISKSGFLPDFFKSTGSSWGDGTESLSSYVIAESYPGSGAVAIPIRSKKTKPKPQITPKGVFQLKTLDEKDFQIKIDPEYVDAQVETFKEKLGMIRGKEFDMNRGTNEIGSILMRLQNRKKYSTFKDFYDEFPYTTTVKISELVKLHDHLKVGEVSQFLADMPKEAVDVMKRYTEQTKKLCEKKPVFYIIANKKDFEKTEKRRDPILLAQSPFGHFWQILGAWDEEMLLIEEL